MARLCLSSSENRYLLDKTLRHWDRDVYTCTRFLVQQKLQNYSRMKLGPVKPTLKCGFRNRSVNGQLCQLD